MRRLLIQALSSLVLMIEPAVGYCQSSPRAVGNQNDALHASKSAEAPDVLTARISKLIADLDDASFEVRDRAAKELINIGQPAVALLTKAIDESAPDRSQAANEIIKSISKSASKLRFVGQIKRKELAGAVTLVLSTDDKFVYVPALVSASVNVFRRDPITGKLAHLQSIEDKDQLQGAVSLRLSTTGKNAVAASCRSKSIALFSRDETTGELRLESVRSGEPDGETKELEWPTEAIFSTDDKFVYATDDRPGRVHVFRIEGGRKLALMQSFSGTEQCFNGARGITAHPDGKTLYVSSHAAGTLVVLNRDSETGTVAIRQILQDEQDGIHGLAGTMKTCVSRDGRFVYATSGRFNGDNAISAFQVQDDGTLKLLQEFINNESDLQWFEGGAKGLTISPDGRRFYAAGVTSGSLACFDRDPQNGKLTYVTTLRGTVTGEDDSVEANLGANGIDMSADGRYLYLALEDAAAISIFESTEWKP